MTPPAVITIAISSSSCASSLSSYSRKRRDPSSGLPDQLDAAAFNDIQGHMLNRRDVEESKEQYDSDDNIERRRRQNEYTATDFSTLVYQHRARDGFEDHQRRQQRVMDRRSFSTTRRRHQDHQRRSMRSSRRSSDQPLPSGRRTLTDDQLGSLFLSLKITETSNEFAQVVNDVDTEVEEDVDEDVGINRSCETASSGDIGNHDVSSHTDDDFVNHVLGSLLDTGAPKQQQQRPNQRASNKKKEGGGVLNRVFKNRRFSWRKNAKKNSGSNSSAQANLPPTTNEGRGGGVASGGNELEDYVLGSLGV